MYFYTGPGGATNDSPINSDDDEETVKVRREEPIYKIQPWQGFSTNLDTLQVLYFQMLTNHNFH